MKGKKTGLLLHPGGARVSSNRPENTASWSIVVSRVHKRRVHRQAGGDLTNSSRPYDRVDCVGAFSEN